MKERNVNVLGKLLVLAVVFGMLTPLIADAQQGTEARLKKLESELQALKAERAEAVPDWIKNIEISGDFRYRLLSGNELPLRCHINAKKAGVANGRGANPHMNLLSPCPSQ